MSAVTPEELDSMIRDGDLEDLEMVLLSGKGAELRGKSAWNAEVRQFLKRVPGYMDKISSLHNAASSGNLKTVRQMTDRDKRLALARAEDGSVALHHIAKSGNLAGVKMVHAMYPDGVNVKDAEGKVPVHYAAQSRSPGARETYEYLEKVGGHSDTEDHNGVTAQDYLNGNGEEEKPKRKPAKSSKDLPVLGRRLQSRFSVPRPRGSSRRQSLEPTPQNSRRNSESKSKPTSRNNSRANSRRNSRANSRRNSRANSRRNSQANSRNNSPAVSRKNSNANSKNNSPADSRKNSPAHSKENSPQNSKNNSRSNSREQTPDPSTSRKVSHEEADAEVEKDVMAQLQLAETGNFDGITDIILRGDGHLLVGRGSQDEETQNFLDRIPSILESAEDMHAAAEAGDTRKVKSLIDRRKKASLRDSNQSNILHKAVLHGHSDLVRYLVQSYPELMNQQDRAGRTPLHYAAVLRDGGHTYKILNKAGADDSVADTEGLSPSKYFENPDSITEKELKAELKDGIPVLNDPSKHNKREGSAAALSDTQDNNDSGDEDEILGSQQGGLRNVDSRTLSLIDRAYTELRTKKSKSLLRKHLSPSIFEKIKRRVTSNGGNLLDVIKLGVTKPDSMIGVTAVDAESYSVFEELFDPIIRDYHDTGEEDLVQPQANFGSGDLVGDFDNFGAYVISTRIRCVRNIDGYPFTPLMMEEQLSELEGEIVPLLESLTGPLEGKYDSVSALSETEAGKLLKQSSESANSGRYWPTGRGIFYNEDYTLVILVNDKNHLKIISMEDSGDLRGVYDRFIDAVNSIDEKFEYTFSSKLGFLTVCPSNLGSAMASSVRIHVPRLNREQQMLQEIAENLQFRVQIVKEDLDGSNADLFDVSYRWPLGHSEEESIIKMYSGILEIISMEKRLENAGRGYRRSTLYGEDESSAQVDSRTLSLIEKAYASLRAEKHNSLLRKHLTPQVFEKIKHRATANGASLLDVIKSGVMNPDSSIGVYAPDAESYDLFKELFDPIINEYHEVQGQRIQHPPMNFGSVYSLGNFDEFGSYVVSTRVRCARNIEGYPFNPLLTRDQYDQLEDDITNALDMFDDDMAGFYRPLSSISEEHSKKLIDDHLLFKQGDRFLEAANACRFWPHGRGIFLNSDSSLIIWINEEDHLRIISMQKGGDLAVVYDRFVRAVSTLAEKLSFSHSSKLGFLSFCPTNLGTGVRASVHIKLPNLMKNSQLLEDTADKYNLQVRGSKGEHSDVEGGIFDISNRRRLGLTEIDAMTEMYHGVSALIVIERQLQENKKRKSRK
ncbi:ATP:guanido phosphotransferase N-terminal [Trinorchestia longiramus]|nr:ATP:guanido phosphotransferase N-terminal [Trinorchestia longiramus]